MDGVRSLVAVAGTALLAGCGGGLHETASVTGTVTWNGEPVKGGIVYATPASGPQATGTIDDEGRFTLVTAGLGSGAVVGKHTVYLGPPAPPDAEEKLDESGYPLPVEEVEWVVDEKYRSPGTAQLEFEVTEDGPNDWAIELPR